MTRVTASRFDTLRTWNGEQSRAFEELSFQLLKDRAPLGTRAIRTGNPDGGVEWYATLPDGAEWGWQAKHVKGIGVVTIAYGTLLRSTPSQADQAKALAEFVHTLVFTRPIRPDELLLDAARGVVWWAVAHQLLPASALVSSQRPYGLKQPAPPPSEATIEAKYGWRKDQPDDESYSSINRSLLSMGDFGRYVVESGLHHFSRYRIGQIYPERQYREPRIIKSRWRSFVASLSDEQRRMLANWERDPESQGMSRLYFPLRREDDPLSETQRALLDAAFVYPKPIADEYPTSGARRWIFRRTISLGWTPKLFGREDRNLGHGRGREGHKAERWGKKYQWMAYHELLARVADNYQACRRYDDSQQYEGFHQIIGEREIDPSLPPIDYRDFNENGGSNTAAWDPPLIRLQEWPPSRLDFNRYRGDVKRFLADVDSEPTVARSTFVRDRDGDEWVVLGSFVKQVDPMAAKGWRGLQQRSAIDTLLITAGDAEAFLAALPDEPHHEIRDLIDSHGHTDCCDVGEVGRVGPKCAHRHEGLRPATIGDRSFSIVPTTERYTWEGGILDCSIGKSATTVLPSTFIQRAAGLTSDMRGPSWLDATGAPIFTCYEEPGNHSHGLLVRTSFLKDFLVTHKIELIILHWFERMRLSDDHRGEDPSVESTIDARLTPDMETREGKQRGTERGLKPSTPDARTAATYTVGDLAQPS